MLRLLTGDMTAEGAWRRGGRPVGFSTGFGLLVPGLLQHRWGQRQRGWVYFGSFASALIVALWSWGTLQGIVFLMLAYLTHIASVTDVLRQVSFPVFPAKRALLLVAFSLGFVIYLPVVTTLSVLAWPGFEPDGTGICFLVDRYAYRANGPREGQWVWLNRSALESPSAAQVVAIPGDEVEWNGRNWIVDGKSLTLQSPGRFKSWPQACRFKVPPNQVLVEPRDEGDSPARVGPCVLVSAERIVGRAWAQFYPVWNRHLL
jgi:hypothetical protein